MPCVSDVPVCAGFWWREEVAERSLGAQFNSDPAGRAPQSRAPARPPGRTGGRRATHRVPRVPDSVLHHRSHCRRERREHERLMSETNTH